MRKLLLLFAGCFAYTVSYTQTFKITGAIKDADKNTDVSNEVIALLIPQDSILYKFTRTDPSGNFSMQDITPGKYILMATHPYYADLLVNLKIDGDTSIPYLKVYSKARLLQEVIIKSGSSFHVKGDTTVYTADSFKVSANANVEELLKKLPGIQVDNNGTITAMGQTVQTVLVDGEEFFGSDPGMAVKNIRADAVKEVQVFDKKSDQAEFTGIDDGKTTKAINLKLKDNSRHGYFGKIDLSGGTVQNNENRYNSNVMASSFKGKRKLSAYLLSGNIGQEGLSWQDEQQYTGGSDLDVDVDDQGNLSVSWTGTDDNEPYIDPQNGYMTNTNAGLFYNNKWQDKYKLNLTPTYQDQQYTNQQQTFTQTQVEDSVLYNNSAMTDNVDRYNFKVRTIVDLNFDSLNSLKIRANTDFYHTQSESNTDATTTGTDAILKNTSNSNLKTTDDKNALSGNILFRHKFKKERRTLSLTGDWNLIGSTGINFLQSINQAYNSGTPSGNQNLDEMKTFSNETNHLNAQVAYTEPLSKNYSVELAYQFAYAFGTNNLFTYNFTPATNKYDFLVDSLSNNFKQNIRQQVPSARMNFSNKKIKANIGAGFGFSNFDLKDLSANKDYVRDYTNFYPSANLTYTYKPSRSIRFSYKGNTIQPSIDQLQPLINNNNYFNQTIGNPNLKPSFTNTFSINENSYNFIKDVYTYLWASSTFTSNAITYNQIINLDSGKTVSQPVNTNGNYSINLYGGIGYRFKKIDTRINFSPNINISKYAEIINSQTSYSKTLSPGAYLGVYKSKEKKYDLSVNNSFNYSFNYLPQSNARLHYITNTVSGNATIYYHKVWSLSSDYQFLYRQKTFPGDNNLRTNLWNARIQRTLHNDEFTIYFSVHDILNQNIGVDRNYNGNTFTQVTNERLKRYFMIGFEWDFKNKAAKPASK